MITIRNQYPVPTKTSRRIEPTGSTRGSTDHQPRRDRALVIVPTVNSADARIEPNVRTQVAAAELVVHVIAGPPRRGIRAESSEQARYRRAYASAGQTSAPPPKWERRA